MQRRISNLIIKVKIYPCKPTVRCIVVPLIYQFKQLTYALQINIFELNIELGEKLNHLLNRSKCWNNYKYTNDNQYTLQFLQNRGNKTDSVSFANRLHEDLAAFIFKNTMLASKAHTSSENPHQFFPYTTTFCSECFVLSASVCGQLNTKLAITTIQQEPIQVHGENGLQCKPLSDIILRYICCARAGYCMLSAVHSRSTDQRRGHFFTTRIWMKSEYSNFPTTVTSLSMISWAQ